MSQQTEPRTDSRSHAGTSGATSGARTRYADGAAATVLVVGGIRVWRRARAALVAAGRAVAETVTPAGWLVLAAAVLGLALGLVFGWVELVVAGSAAVVLLLLSVPFLFGGRSYDVALRLDHERVVAGGDATGRIVVTNTGRGVALPGAVEVPIGDGLVEVQVPLLRRGARFAEEVVIPARRRGIVTIGPVRAVRGDPVGILRREASWTDTHTLYIHPVTTALPSVSTGFIRDLEGNPSSLVVDADISFHALREYAPGDAQRQIHWKSTAKTGTLMVRQYEESRRSRMVVALATEEEEFGDDDEFELAVSVAASIGARGIRDGRDVHVVVGGEVPEFARRRVHSIRELPTVSGRTLLDALSGVERDAGITALPDVARLAGEAHPDVSIAFLVCGPAATPRMLQTTALAFPLGVGVVAVVCDPRARPGLRTLGDVAVVTVGLVDDLRQILSRGAAS
ncbi:DUF58 domain-containing protein [Microbacterium sp. X-17]|uniref:DUF58 domain-containing protein n=1 Tax=Microbacterium sp. X-17 TaxID=3144404 RepID=UPI0031F50077